MDVSLDPNGLLQIGHEMFVGGREANSSGFVWSAMKSTIWKLGVDFGILVCFVFEFKMGLVVETGFSALKRQG